jgi:hypothetical protein
MVRCCAILLLLVGLASPVNALEIMPDFEGKTTLDQLLLPDAFITVNGQRWDNFAYAMTTSNAAYQVAPEEVIFSWGELQATSEVEFFQWANYQIPAGETFNLNISFDATKKVGEVGFGTVAPSFQGSLGGLSGPGGRLNVTVADHATTNTLHDVTYGFDSFGDWFPVIPPQFDTLADKVSVSLNASAENGTIWQADLSLMPGPVDGDTAHFPKGPRFRGVLGGSMEVGGIDAFLRVEEAGNFTASVALVNVSDLPSELFESAGVPTYDGVVQVFSFNFDGELVQEGSPFDLIHTITVGYDPLLYSIPDGLSVIHEYAPGQWYKRPIAFHDTVNHRITFMTPSFSDFALLQNQVPEPSTCWLLLLGIPLIARMKHGRRTADN